MHTNPSNLALLFGSSYTQRINSSLNPVANPFYLQPLPNALLLAHVNEHALLHQSSGPSGQQSLSENERGDLARTNGPADFLLHSPFFPIILIYCIRGIGGYFFACSFSIHLCTTVVITIYSMTCQDEECWISQKKSSASYNHVHRHGTGCRVGVFLSLTAITALPTCSFCQEPTDPTDLEWHEVRSGS